MLKMAIGNKHKAGIKKSGFTLLEVIVAFTILIVGVMAITPVMVFMLKGNIHNKRVSNAKALASQYAENFRALNYTDLSLTDDADTTDLQDMAAPDHADTLVVERETFFVMWNIAQDVPKSGVKSVNIIVAWDDIAMKGRTQVNFLTYKAAVNR